MGAPGAARRERTPETKQKNKKGAGPRGATSLNATRTHLGQVVVDVVLVQGVVGWHEGIIDIVSGGVDDRQLGFILTGRLQGTWGGWGRGSGLRVRGLRGGKNKNKTKKLGQQPPPPANQQTPPRWATGHACGEHPKNLHEILHMWCREALVGWHGGQGQGGCVGRVTSREKDEKKERESEKTVGATCPAPTHPSPAPKPTQVRPMHTQNNPGCYPCSRS